MKKIIFLSSILCFAFLYFFLIKKENIEDQNINLNIPNTAEIETAYTSNTMKDVKYFSKDSKGNKFTIQAKEGEIDINNPEIIFLKNVSGLIELIDSETITINSDFGKYNTNNSSSIFSKNVIVKYLDNLITGEYLDFLLERNTIIFSRNIIFNNPQSVINSDVMEIDVDTKNTRIYMFEKNKKVYIKSKN